MPRKRELKLQRLIELIKSNADHIRMTFNDFIHLNELIESHTTDKLLDVGNIDHDYFIARHREKQGEYIRNMKYDIKRLRDFLATLESRLNELEPIIAKDAEEHWHE